MAGREKGGGITRRGLMLVLSSPSGAGKTTLSRKLLDEDKNVMLSVSVTTRKMRPGEKDGRDYHFIDRRRLSKYEDEMIGEVGGTFRYDRRALLESVS